MTITWLGQSGYLLKTSNTQILIDPYLSDVVNRVANRPRLVPTPINPAEVTVDAVICTHNHLDHLDVDAIPLMPDGQLFISTKEGVEVLSGLGKQNTRSLSVGETIRIGDCCITAVFADHTVEAFGLVVTACGITMYFSGDTLFNERLFVLNEFSPDITFICINGKLGNMNVEEAILTASKINAKVNVPNHYGMFASNTEDPTKFTTRISNGFIMEFAKYYDVDELLGRGVQV